MRASALSGLRRTASRASASCRCLSAAASSLGVAHYRAGDTKAAIAALHKSMELRQGGDGNDWFFLAMAHWQLGEKEQAHKWFDQAVQWMEKNDPRNEDLRRFRDEAEHLLGVNKKKM